MGKKDGVKALSKASGISEQGIKNVWKQVKENKDRLDNCKGPHNFSVQVKEIATNWMCPKCNGVVSGINKTWYEKGLEHGKEK